MGSGLDLLRDLSLFVGFAARLKGCLNIGVKANAMCSGLKEKLQVTDNYRLLSTLICKPDCLINVDIAPIIFPSGGGLWNFLNFSL